MLPISIRHLAFSAGLLLAACSTGTSNNSSLTRLEVQPATPQSVAVRRGSLKQYAIYFDFDQDVLTASGSQMIDQIAEDFRRYNARSISVDGHTDTMGTVTYNQGLSERRARRVLLALVQEGVPTGLVREEALSELEPAIETGDQVKEGRNRRVIVEIAGIRVTEREPEDDDDDDRPDDRPDDPTPQ